MQKIKSLLLRYCNSRVSVYDEAGRHMHDINGDWTVVHSLALYEQVRSLITSTAAA